MSTFDACTGLFGCSFSVDASDMPDNRPPPDAQYTRAMSRREFAALAQRWVDKCAERDRALVRLFGYALLPAMVGIAGSFAAKYVFGAAPTFHAIPIFGMAAMSLLLVAALAIYIPLSGYAFVHKQQLRCPRCAKRIPNADWTCFEIDEQHLSECKCSSCGHVIARW